MPRRRCWTTLKRSEQDGNDDRIEGPVQPTTRDASINFKAKGKTALVSVLACNLLMAAYEEDENLALKFLS
ncbi:unnamed protein product, partial [Ranitomeya imitator]